MNNTPLRFRFATKNGQHPNGSANQYGYGCYFPMTDLCVTDMGKRGTGKPSGVEWLDPASAEFLRRRDDTPYH